MRKEFPLANMKHQEKKYIKAIVLTGVVLELVSEAPFQAGNISCRCGGKGGTAPGLSHRSEDWGPPK